MNPWIIGVVGLVVGVIGTGLGGVFTALAKKTSNQVLSIFLGFAGGIMLAIIFAELIPEAIHGGGLTLAMIGLVIGVGLLVLLDRHFPQLHHGDDPAGKLTKMGYMIALGIALHNLPEGIAIGAGYASQSQLGFTLAVVLALHNIPEGIAMAAPLQAGGVGSRIVILATILAGVPVGFGALIGAALGEVSPLFLTMALGFAAGAMLYISFDELLPEAHSHADGSHNGIYGGVLGVLIGYILISVF